MGFETKIPYATRCWSKEYLNYFPMGFETAIQKKVDVFTWDLNYFPMGFETIYGASGKLPQKKIWTISLWDLKRLGRDRNSYRQKIWTISLWDLKPLNAPKPPPTASIWTISLWDLKRTVVTSIGDMLLFELFPYGIWNHSWLLGADTRSCNLNYFPMGFETWIFYGYSFFYAIWTISLWDLKPNYLRVT